ncbi:protocatechuate 3,4-dioxygenase subunit alpha [soil metagenome]
MSKPDGITPSQTAGPYFAFALTSPRYGYQLLLSNDLVTPDTVGDPIRIEGRIFDGDGNVVPDAFVELWQADGSGRYSGKGDRPNTTFKGFGRCETDAAGTYSFRTVKPGPVPGPDGLDQAPHIDVSIFARGVLNRIFTRVYFEDEPANAADAILGVVPLERRRTLIARRDGAADGVPRYVFDIRLQGKDETVFFEA